MDRLLCIPVLLVLVYRTSYTLYVLCTTMYGSFIVCKVIMAASSGNVSLKLYQCAIHWTFMKQWGRFAKKFDCKFVRSNACSTRSTECELSNMYQDWSSTLLARSCRGWWLQEVSSFACIWVDTDGRFRLALRTTVLYHWHSKSVAKAGRFQLLHPLFHYLWTFLGIYEPLIWQNGWNVLFLEPVVQE